MARAIYDESVEYEDGTPNNSSQISKDVSQFLAWASYPEHDQRKKMGLKALAISGVLLGMSLWWKRFKWSYVKSRKFIFTPNKVYLISKSMFFKFLFACRPRMFRNEQFIAVYYEIFFVIWLFSLKRFIYNNVELPFLSWRQMIFIYFMIIFKLFMADELDDLLKEFDLNASIKTNAFKFE